MKIAPIYGNPHNWRSLKIWYPIVSPRFFVHPKVTRNWGKTSHFQRHIMCPVSHCLGHWLQSLWSIAFRKKSLVSKMALQNWLHVPRSWIIKRCVFRDFDDSDDLEDFQEVDNFLGPQEI